MNLARRYKKEIALAFGVLIGGVLFFLGYSQALTPGASDIGFAQDMSVHHAQAVDMSFIISERTDNEAIRSFAFDIINTQSTQRGMMLGWLQLWNESLNSDGSMTWMGGDHAGHGAHMDTKTMMEMMGMASTEDMNRLTSLSDAEAEKLFLSLMTKHHVGGVEMAEALLKQSTNGVVRALAQSMVDGQQSEIEYMAELLAKYE